MLPACACFTRLALSARLPGPRLEASQHPSVNCDRGVVVGCSARGAWDSLRECA